MNTNRTNTVSAKARREYNASADSLVAAEELRDLLRSQYETMKMNPYFLDALDRANALVIEMDADLDDVMSRYTPEQCGL